MIPGIGAVAPSITSGSSILSGTGATGLAVPTSGVDGGQQSFAAMLSNAIGNTVGQLKQAEQVSVDALQGKADMRQVVDSVMSAEQSMQAAVAIRDKIVSAYLEVSRMAI